MNRDEYINEIELIEKQNNNEYDLYTIIANVLRERKSFKKISLRCVGKCIRTKDAREKVFWALKGFSDFVIIDKEYVPVENNTDKKLVYGAVEVKNVGSSILTRKDDQLQLIGQLLWFKKVIYTNGLEWRFYNEKWEIDENIINYKQNLSYVKYARKHKNEEADKEIDDYLNDFKISNLEYISFTLCKKINGQRVWDIIEWEKLIKYLDEYI